MDAPYAFDSSSSTDRPGRPAEPALLMRRRPRLEQPDQGDPDSLLGVCDCGVWTLFETADGWLLRARVRARYATTPC